MKLPLEELREKYIPVDSFPEKYGLSVSLIMELISKHHLRVAEFKAPGDFRRTLHVNYEEVLAIISKEEESK